MAGPVTLSDFPFLLVSCFFQRAVHASVDFLFQVLCCFFMSGYKERRMPIFFLLRQPEISMGVIEEALTKLHRNIVESDQNRC